MLAETGMAVIRLPCSPKAHTGLIVLLGRRCSLKRAVGDELTTIFKKQQASLEGTFKRAIGDQSALIPRKGGTSKLGGNIVKELAAAEPDGELR